ncbi:MAG: PAS domain S-box protein [Spirochaetota bacterium]
MRAPGEVYHPFVLFGVMNGIFVAGIPFAVAYLAARSYLISGLPSILFLGCGVLCFGLGNFFPLFVLELNSGINAGVTIHNCGMLTASIFHTLSAVFISREVLSGARSLKNKEKTLTVMYTASVLILALVLAGTRVGAIPIFFIQNQGPTPVRQLVLTSAIILFTFSTLLFAGIFFRTFIDFIYWYSLSLTLIAIGLAAVLLAKNVGSPLSWAGRSAQYTGGIYFLVSVIKTQKTARVKNIPLEKALSRFFREAEVNYRILVNTSTDAIISFNREGRIILWNPAAEKIFGYTLTEASSLSLFDLVASRDRFQKIWDSITHLASQKSGFFSRNSVQMDLRKKQGTLISGELSFSVRKTPHQWTGTVIIRDITRQKQAEQALKEAYDEMERRVYQRTRELAAANYQLKKEIEERKQVQDALQKSEKRLRSLSAKLITVQEDERKRISNELHDSISQSLAAVKYSIEDAIAKAGKNTPVSRALEPVIAILQQTVKETRQIIKNLRPCTLDNLGLIPTISLLCEDFREIYSAIHVEQHINIDENDIPLPLKLVIYRVIQEALNCIAAHSNADNVDVYLGRNNRTIQLTIKENGSEKNIAEMLDPETAARRVPSSIKERTEFSGGQLDAEYLPGQGTAINALWPCSSTSNRK